MSDHGRAIITGASAGIGAEYARQLAQRGYDLFLTARRADRLAALCEELHAAHGIDARYLAADLLKADERERLCMEAAALPDVTLLVNNAGFGVMGDFTEAEIGKHTGMVEVHITATLELTRAVLPSMTERKRGAIINVSSIAAYFNGTTYSATKSFLNTFSRGLAGEVRPHGIHVQALCPGYTYSEFHDTPDHAAFKRENIPRPLWQTAETVVAFSLAQLGNGRVEVIPGWRNRFLVFTMRIGLRPLVRRIRDFLLRR